MQRSLKAISSTASVSAAVLAMAIALAGCGSGGSSTPTKEASIALSSSAIEGTALPAHYTCDGANINPPLKWGAVPANTRELVLFAIGKPASESSSASSTIEWALAGIKPELGHVAAGKVPSGAYLEQASDGKRHYSICPPKGQSRLYAFALYAVPPRIIVTRSVNGDTLYHNLAEGKPEFRATGSGTITTSYTRK